MTRRFDAHQHFWNPSRLHYPILSPEVFGDLYRTVEPPELEPLLQAVGMDGTVAVQAKDGTDETEYLLELASRYDWIAGVVGWVDLARPSVACKQLERFVAHPKFKGVRHLIMVDPDPDWLVRPNVLDGLRLLAEADLPFDVGAEFPLHLRHVPTVAERIPGLRLVIDHLAKPPAEEEAFRLWAAEMRNAASYPQVYAKVSALDPSRDIRTLVDFAFDVFGADRLMFGSDWPLAHFRGGYEAVWRSLDEAVRGRSQEERDALFGGTAATFYRIR